MVFISIVQLFVYVSRNMRIEVMICYRNYIQPNNLITFEIALYSNLYSRKACRISKIGSRVIFSKSILTLYFVFIFKFLFIKSSFFLVCFYMNYIRKYILVFEFSPTLSLLSSTISISSIFFSSSYRFSSSSSSSSSSSILFSASSSSKIFVFLNSILTYKIPSSVGQFWKLQCPSSITIIFFL